MRLVVTGRDGQVARALRALAGPDLEVVALGRPEFDLARPETLSPILQAARPDAVVNAAAYTMVDKAEDEEALATGVNGAAAGAVAAIAAVLDVPIIQISTDYVFDGMKREPYLESDPVAPLGAYGRSKLAGERAVAAAAPRHVILRTSWVYDGEGKNFLTTMLRLAATRETVNVVADQHGAPSYAPDIAEAVSAIARRLVQAPSPEAYGVFHMTGGRETTWAGFAREIFAHSKAGGGSSALVEDIPTSAYPTPARRPANSRLDCGKLARTYGIALPHWQDALARCFAAMTRAQGAQSR